MKSRHVDLSFGLLKKVKTKIVQRVLNGALQKEGAALENFDAGLLFSLIGGSTEALVDRLPTKGGSDVQIILKSLVKAVDEGVEDYAHKKGYSFIALENDDPFASDSEEKPREDDEDETEDVFAEKPKKEEDEPEDKGKDNESLFDEDSDDDNEDDEDEESDDDAEMVADDFDSTDEVTGFGDGESITSGLKANIEIIFNELKERTAADIKRVGETILKMERISEDETLDKKKEESGEFVSEDIGEDDESEENEDGDKESSSDWGDGENSSEEEGEESGDDGDDNEEGDNDDSDPFGSDSSQQMGSENPFDKDEGADVNSDDKVYSEIASRILGRGLCMDNRLAGGELLKYAKKVGKKATKHATKHIANFSLESQGDLYTKSSKAILHKTVDTIVTGALLGLEMDLARVLDK